MSKLSSNQLQEDQARRCDTSNHHQPTKRLNILMKLKILKYEKKLMKIYQKFLFASTKKIIL